MKHDETYRRFLILSAAGLLAAGCAAQGEVSYVHQDMPKGTVSTADLFLVREFDTSQTPAFGDGHESEEVVEIHRRRIREELAMRLVRHLEAQGFQAHPYNEADAAGDAVIIDGQVVHNDRGSWALRVWVGFGSGQTSLKSRVWASRAVTPETKLFEADVAAGSGGSSGWFGIGDFIPTDTENTALAVVRYIKDRSAAGGDS